MSVPSHRLAEVESHSGHCGSSLSPTSWCEELLGVPLPSVHLLDTRGGEVDVALLALEPTVLFAYPGSDTAPARAQDPDGLLGSGCTVQSLEFARLAEQFGGQGIQTVGLSSLSVLAQRELVEREELPFVHLSDPDFELADALGLPTMRCPGAQRLYQRFALLASEGAIERVLYPVPIPRRNAIDALGCLSLLGLAA